MMNTEQQQDRLPIEILAPWSNIVLKSRIPDNIFKDLLEMYDEVMSSKWDSQGKNLVGQIDEEPTIKIDNQKRHPNWINFCILMIRKFLIAQQNTNQISETTDSRKINSNQFVMLISSSNPKKTALARFKNYKSKIKADYKFQIFYILIDTMLFYLTHIFILID